MPATHSIPSQDAARARCDPRSARLHASLRESNPTTTPRRARDTIATPSICMAENGECDPASAIGLPDMLDADQCYAALVARDRRFDGVFFVGVTSTAVYCRPVCPARRPLRKRCVFFANAASAERDGFRPCLRCRPELAPGHAPMDDSGTLAHAAARRIRATPAISPTTLARELGVSERQLRRIVQDKLGVAPVQLAQTSRLLLAKQLLTETSLPITRVAIAAGFGSVRRFNHLFADRYRLAPSDFRRAPREKRATSSERGLSVRLAYRPPLAWEKLLTFLADHAIPGVEWVDSGAYLRTLRIGKCVGWLCVRPERDTSHMTLTISDGLTTVLSEVIAGVRALLDLDCRPDVIDTHLAADPMLAPSLASQPGLRVPGAMDGFELLWRTVLGQQVSVKGATTLSGRVARALGERITTPIAALTHLTPTSRRVGRFAPSALQELGVTGSRATCIIDVARAIEGGLVVKPGASPEIAGAALRAIRGIGPWTEAYVAMRGLAWPDAIPETDLFIKRTLERLPPGASERWKPWRAYATMHVWNLASMAEQTKTPPPRVKEKKQ